ncbi:MAG: nicotinate-nucleotide pyrophosphorylase [Candidatus Syntrophoarchaeum butanivorans]|uniref:Nicotinate-nucleotide pyrophosphorylase [carboxylating] n=2 Tax=Candidatus Syntropharchaeum butanivorans TaxID=1839936 RepID=A0A1F2P6Z7_9EURY|nr:MAG: nicotinate-nucleotide pyrophosphorylase [Candidatus Syntrophoarchaeum butanivorans]
MDGAELIAGISMKGVIERFIEEDLGGYIEFMPEGEAKAEIVVKEDGILSGIREAGSVFEYFNLLTDLCFEDGDPIRKGDVVLRVKGDCRDILKAERLALNFLGRMSGIATLTHEFVKRAAPVKIAATRKTTPGFRIFEKRAVVAGGGDPHRFNIADMVMIKKNHIALIGLERAIELGKGVSFTKKVEVEVTAAEDALRAAELGADVIMFDNMRPDEIREAISSLEARGLRERVLLEASGGITLDNVSEYAASGVDVISVGAITHHAVWLDFSLRIV